MSLSLSWSPDLSDLSQSGRKFRKGLRSPRKAVQEDSKSKFFLSFDRGVSATLGPSGICNKVPGVSRVLQETSISFSGGNNSRDYRKEINSKGVESTVAGVGNLMQRYNVADISQECLKTSVSNDAGKRFNGKGEKNFFKLKKWKNVPFKVLLLLRIPLHTIKKL